MRRTFGLLIIYLTPSTSFRRGNPAGQTTVVRTTYSYPKHVTVFNNEVIVSSRNDGDIVRYDQSGALLGSIDRSSTGQGLATDGTFLYRSFWNGANSAIEQFDAAFSLVTTFANPSGLGANNIVDFAYNADSMTWFGMTTSGEGGTGTNSQQIVEFSMGGSVLSTYAMPFSIEAIGQFGGPGCTPSACPRTGSTVGNRRFCVAPAASLKLTPQAKRAVCAPEAERQGETLRCREGEKAPSPKWQDRTA